VSVLTGADATRAQVLAALETLAARTTQEAMAIVYFSGHGYLVNSAQGKDYFLMPYGYALNDLPSTAIADREFAAALGQLRTKKLLVLLDCCHAGGIEKTKAPNLMLEKAPIPPEAERMFASGSGRVVIASSRADEVSFAGEPYSAFTLALIEGLTGSGVNDQDSYVRVADLAMYTSWRVRERTNDRQHPVLRFEKADNFPVAYYAGGELKPKGTPFDIPTRIEAEPGAGLKPQEGANVNIRTQHWTARGHIISSERDIDLRGANLSMNAPPKQPD
jgi:uncharacterized caspase-like protein